MTAQSRGYGKVASQAVGQISFGRSCHNRCSSRFVREITVCSAVEKSVVEHEVSRLVSYQYNLNLLLGLTIGTLFVEARFEALRFLPRISRIAALRFRTH